MRFPRATHRNIYVRSERAGQRVMEGISTFISKKLKLKVNQEKSAVGRPVERKFLGFRFIGGKKPRRGIAPQSILRFKARIRELTRRKRSISLEERIERLSRYLIGWRGYFGFCETPTVLIELDSWIRRRLRSVIWRQWKTSGKRFAELKKLGVSWEHIVATVKSCHGPWRISKSPATHRGLSNAYFKKLGLPALAPG